MKARYAAALEKLRVKVDMKEAAELVRISRSMGSINGGQTLIDPKIFIPCAKRRRVNHSSLNLLIAIDCY